MLTHTFHQTVLVAGATLIISLTILGNQILHDRDLRRRLLPAHQGPIPPLDLVYLCKKSIMHRGSKDTEDGKCPKYNCDGHWECISFQKPPRYLTVSESTTPEINGLYKMKRTSTTKPDFFAKYPQHSWPRWGKDWYLNETSGCFIYLSKLHRTIPNKELAKKEKIRYWCEVNGPRCKQTWIWRYGRKPSCTNRYCRLEHCCKNCKKAHVCTTFIAKYRIDYWKCCTADGKVLHKARVPNHISSHADSKSLKSYAGTKWEGIRVDSAQRALFVS